MKKYIVPFLVFLSLGYFIFHTVSGERGFLALLEKRKRIEQTRKILANLNEEKEIIEKRIKLLGEEIDLDMLEECAKRQLHFSFPEEKIIINRKSGGSDET